MPSEARLVEPDAHAIITESLLARRAIMVTQSTFGRFSHYLSLIYTVALVVHAFEPSYPTNIVPLSDLCIMSTRVLDPLRSGSSYLYSSPSWNDVKPMPVHVMIGRRIFACGGVTGMTAGSGIKTTFPLSSLAEEQKRNLLTSGCNNGTDAAIVPTLISRKHKKK